MYLLNLQLIVYNDGFDSNNPLGDYRNSDKVNGTYFKIGNFDECYLSLSYFVQLAILADVKSVKKFGYETIFKPNLKGTISFFPADNLASNGVGGFVESFNCGLSNCRFCKTKDPAEFQTMTLEQSALLRTIETNRQDLDLQILCMIYLKESSAIISAV